MITQITMEYDTDKEAHAAMIEAVNTVPLGDSVVGSRLGPKNGPAEGYTMQVNGGLVYKFVVKKGI